MSAASEQDECLRRLEENERLFKAGKRTKSEHADVRQLWEREAVARTVAANEDRKLMAAATSEAAA